MLALLCGAAQAQLPSFEQVRAAHQPSDALLLDRNGEPLADLRFNLKVRRFEWVPLAQFSPALREALIAAEDRRFFEHEGVDWRAFVGSLWHNLWHDNKRGGSTLTMQLAGLLDPAIALPNTPGGRRSYGQKWDQGLAAQELEARWTKAQILEAYLNLAPFRGDLQGVHAASAVFFGKTPGSLDRPEALLVTALLPSPNARADRIAKRACARARKMNAANLCPRVSELAPRLDTPRNRPRFTLAPQLARRLLHNGGERIVSTLDSATQQAATEALRHALQVSARRITASAAIVVDQADGSVRAWVGGLEPDDIDAVAGVRSMQPALWMPFAAANLVERKLAHGASLLPISSEGEAPWRSLRMLVQHAEANPIAPLLGLAELPLDRMRQAGIDLPRDPTAAPEMNLLQATQALRPFSTGGQWQALRWLSDTPPAPARKLWRADTSYIVGEWLADLAQRGGASELLSPESGWQTVWRMSDPGNETSIAFSGGERYAIAVLVAGSGGGSEHPARLASRGLREVQRQLALPVSRAPRTPASVLNTVVAFDPPIEPARREWFLRGTEVALSSPPEFATGERQILHPQASTQLVVLHPGESLVLEATPAARGGRWWADGELLGEGPRIIWAPPAGRYRLELRSPDGSVWDSREFTLEHASRDTER
ncbi:transglycosylase domain-containing protein [Niveibacterium sp. 24ML]|uniref:transglycosylase domain-containing protein n=1 Tax=Niveibacterium sp. 24ML TaxID=2985512 RepID=UPI00227073EC|nr:transglycosylase domain-containing protein [Niveibacterium sp. 24ML]MCX9157509.1 transglycosylase domain-containing protein [Niveibacterium sp. 24ML]